MNNDFQRIKDAINLADYIGRYAPLKRAGTVMQCCCPLPGHNDKSPSFQVKGEGWICRGKCDAYGDIFDFVERYHGWDKQQALEELSRYAGITLTPLTPEHKAQADKRERVYALLNEAAKIYHNYLFQYLGQGAENYLKNKRGLSIQTITDAQLGYAPAHIREIVDPLKRLGYGQDEMLQAGLLSQHENDKSTFYPRFHNRVMIPLRDQRGRVVGFVGRAMQDDQNPKYLTGPGTDLFKKSELIYVPKFPAKTGAGGAQTVRVVVEGQMDAISALNRGFDNVYASMGVSLSSEQMDLICKGDVKRVVFCLDRDEAGRKSLKTLTEKHLASLATKGIELYAMFAPHGKDPDDTFRERPELWQPAVDAAQPVVNVLIDLELNTLGMNATAPNKSKLARDLLPILKSDNPFVTDENLRTLADKVGISFAELKSWMMPQLRILPKLAPVAANIPTLETAILWGILFNEHDKWMTRANMVLMCLAPLDRDMPYALGPLTPADFTHGEYQQLMGLIIKDLPGIESAVINTPLYDVYHRVTMKPIYTASHAADTPKEQKQDTYDDFVIKVLRLRLYRLKGEMVGSKHFSEIVQAIGLIQRRLVMK
jgi:DNA primase